MVDLSFIVKYGNNRDFEKTQDILFDLYDKFTSDPLIAEDEFIVKIGNEEYDVDMEDLIYGLCFLPVRFPLKRNLTIEDCLLNPSDYKTIEDSISSYINDTIKEHDHLHELSTNILHAVNTISNLSWDVNYIEGSTINIYDIIHLLNKDKRLDELVNFKSDENTQFSEIEESVALQTKEFVEILTGGKYDTCYMDVIPSVSLTQLQEVFINISLKPDVFGNIIEKPVNTNFFQGMRDSTDYFINATGARKALITNADQVSTAGYLGRRLALLCINQLIDKEVDDCGTDEYFKYTIKNKVYAERFRHRYYKEKLADKELKVVSDIDDIIGKTLYFRSPTGCKLENPKLCCKCFGALAKESPYHSVLLIMLELGRIFIQRLLSSKHLLKVQVEKINLDEELSDLFEIQKNVIIAKKDVQITILDYVEEDLISNRLISTIEIRAKGDNDSDPVEYTFTNDFDVFDSILSKDSESHIKGIPVEVDAGEIAFKINVENNELSAPLKKLIRLLENENELNTYGSMDNLISAFIDLLVDNKIGISAVGIESFINQLARNPDNIYERFKDRNAFHVLGLKKALINNPSPAIGIAFERLKNQINNGLHNRDAESVLDIMF